MCISPGRQPGAAGTLGAEPAGGMGPDGSVARSRLDLCAGACILPRSCCWKSCFWAGGGSVSRCWAMCMCCWRRFSASCCLMPRLSPPPWGTAGGLLGLWGLPPVGQRRPLLSAQLCPGAADRRPWLHAAACRPVPPDCRRTGRAGAGRAGACGVAGPAGGVHGVSGQRLRQSLPVFPVLILILD